MYVTIFPLNPAHVWSRQQNPIVRTRRDKFRSLISFLKSANTVNEHASGITEIVSEADHLLDGFLIEFKEHKEETRERRNDLIQREIQIATTGKAIQSASIKQGSENHNYLAVEPKSKKPRHDELQIRKQPPVLSYSSQAL